MKGKATVRKSQAQNAPYDSSARGRKHRAKCEDPTPASVPSLIPNASAPAMPNPGNGTMLFRDVMLHNAHNLNPDVVPRNDWELLELSSERMKGTLDEIYAHLDKKYAQAIKTHGAEGVVQSSADMLNQRVEPTGIKPRPGEVSKYIHVRPIPDSKYSIRLFPGSISAAEYCMDFVDSKTGEPVNSPFEYELWAVPDPETPWLGMPVCHQMRSIERMHGIKQKDILPGHEKFILRDGQTCVLHRPGKPGVRFNVPVRKQPETLPQPELHVITFPRVIDV